MRTGDLGYDMSPSSLASTESDEDPIIKATAIAIDKDRNSQYAVRWAVEKLMKRNDCVILVHVKTQSILQSVNSKSSIFGFENPKGPVITAEHEMQHFFLPYRGFCGRKGVRTKEIVLHDIDISNALVDFINENAICNMVLGASGRSAFTRAFRNSDVPTTLSKAAPRFCSVHVVSKGKANTVRQASQPCPPISSKRHSTPRSEENYRNNDYMQSIPRERYNRSDIASSQHPPSSPNKCGRIRGSSSNQDYVDIDDFSAPPSFQSTDLSGENLNNSYSSDASRRAASPVSSGDLETEMRRLRLELKKTMNMYNSASKEVASVREKAKDIDKWKSEEALKLQEVKNAHEAALALAEVEKEKTKAAMEAANMAQRIAELEVQKRKNVELKVQYEAEERKKAMKMITRTEVRYRKYSIGDIEIATNYFADSMKIGEGGYGPVYKADLDHTAVAIKVLRPDISQGQKQFEREVEVLSYVRHPNMVLLLGACSEYGCLVYEYMENGSLEDRIFRRNNTPSMTWQLRFKIAAEIATALLFLHQTKPEPLVHRDLKPANILLDQNYVSKISDVGLSRLVPASVADSVTQYHLTSAAGTFCYIDPEYQQTGMLGVKSDIYSFGILLLQLITAKSAMGLTHYVDRAVTKGTLADMLDPTEPNWPIEEALGFAKLALKCCELRRKDRPDLVTVILPELKRLGNLGSDDGVQRGPRPYDTSSEKTSYHRRPPFSEGPRRKSYCGALPDTDKSPLWKEGKSESCMNPGE